MTSCAGYDYRETLTSDVAFSTCLRRMLADEVFQILVVVLALAVLTGLPVIEDFCRDIMARAMAAPEWTPRPTAGPIESTMKRSHLEVVFYQVVVVRQTQHSFRLYFG